jgi:hypothetical protein
MIAYFISEQAASVAVEISCSWLLLQAMDNGRNIVPTKETVATVHATGSFPRTYGAVGIKIYRDHRVLVRTHRISKFVEALVVALCALLRQAFVEIGVERRSDRKGNASMRHGGIDFRHKLVQTHVCESPHDSPAHDRNEKEDYAKHGTNETV